MNSAMERDVIRWAEEQLQGLRDTLEQIRTRNAALDALINAPLYAQGSFEDDELNPDEVEAMLGEIDAQRAIEEAEDDELRAAWEREMNDCLYERQVVESVW